MVRLDVLKCACVGGIHVALEYLLGVVLPMRIVMWIFRLALFLVLFGFAVKNDQIVSLHFFFGNEWKLSLVFVILVAFAAGAVLGVTATFASLLRNRREIGRLRRDAAKAEKELRDAERATAVVVRKAD
jgi:uncharacterized integral membrane protein